MLNPKLARSLRNLPPIVNRYRSPRSSSSPFAFDGNYFRHSSPPSSLSSVFGHHSVNLSPKLSPTFDFSFASRFRYSTTTNAASDDDRHENPQKPADSDDEEKPVYFKWIEEDEPEPEIGDGGRGGGVVLQNCPWGEKALSIAQDVLLQFGNDLQIFAFKISEFPHGHIHVRLDRLSEELGGCPSMEDVRNYCHAYRDKLNEAAAAGHVPKNLGVQVFIPGPDRLLKIPDDLERFKYLAMRVKYVERDDIISPIKEGIFFLESVESGSCVWRLADVKANCYMSSLGRRLTREQKEWRLKLPFEEIEKVILYFGPW